MRLLWRTVGSRKRPSDHLDIFAATWLCGCLASDAITWLSRRGSIGIPNLAPDIPPALLATRWRCGAPGWARGDHFVECVTRERGGMIRNWPSQNCFVYFFSPLWAGKGCLETLSVLFLFLMVLPYCVAVLPTHFWTLEGGGGKNPRTFGLCLVPEWRINPDTDAPHHISERLGAWD